MTCNVLQLNETYVMLSLVAKDKSGKYMPCIHGKVFYVHTSLKYLFMGKHHVCFKGTTDTTQITGENHCKMFHPDNYSEILEN